MHSLHSCNAMENLLQRNMELYVWVKSDSGRCLEQFRAFAQTRKDLVMLAAFINFLRAWKRYNASLNELYQLGDRELADIGITRSDIPRIAWDNAHRGKF